MTYKEARTEAERKLAKAGIDEAANDSLLLMDHVCGAGLGLFLLIQNEEMPEEMRAKYFSLADERAKRIPLQHITGTQSFMGLDIRVNENVLIPRQDTEILGEEAVSLLTALFMEWIPIEREDGRWAAAPDVLDLGTGSGCLAVAIKAFCPDSDVWASDISEEALSLARENAGANQADICFINSDLFEKINRKFDVIVSNPPYIPACDIDSLMPEVRDHEPHIALDGGKDGLSFYRRILDGCETHLYPGGYLLMEIGFDQADAVTAMMRENGFDDISIIKDLAGLDRVVRGRRN